MKYAWLVACREYSENARTKGFWISLFLFPAILFLSMQVPAWLEQKATPVRHFVLVDQSSNLAAVVVPALERNYQRKVLAALKDYARKEARGREGAAAPAPVVNEFDEANAESLDAFVRQGGQAAWLEKLRPALRPEAPAFVAPRRVFVPVPLPPEVNPRADLAVIAEALKPYLRQEKQVVFEGAPVELAAAILVPPEIEACIARPSAPGAAPSPATVPAAIQYWAANTTDAALRDEVQRAVNDEIHRREYLARGLDEGAIRQVDRTYARFASLNPKKEKGREAVGTVDLIRQWAPSAFVYLLWVAIFTIMQMLLSNTIEEKSNRIIEVLLSSVTPGELMMGKLLGIAAVGLSMIGAWMVALFGILSWKAGGSSELAGQIFTVLRTSNLVLVFAVYFLLGYLMYAAFILALGSLCNTLKEAQSYMGVVTMIMMVPLLTLAFIPKDPNGTLARVLSWIPLYTPFTMMNRANADPPLVDLVGTLILLVVCAAGALYLAGKIFRIGILRTGQPPRLVELVRWVTRSRS